MGHLYETDEKELLLLISKGDRAAFSFLYNRYGNNLLRFVSSFCFSKEVSEEIVQDLFVKIWSQREDIIYVTAIKPYLYRSAKNLLLNYVRTLQKEARVLEVIRADALQTTNHIEDEVIYNEYYGIAQTAIDLLPVKRKMIFKMRHDDDLSLDEISERLSISKSVVKKQLYSGIHFVREYLNKRGDIATLFIGILLYLKR
jgi:RNA polymerase sigma-70 factor (family 1)